MRRAVACAVLLALVAAAPGDARRKRTAHRPAKHRVHAPPTPRIKAGAAVPLSLPATTPLSLPADAPAADPAPAAPVAALPRTLGVSASEFALALTRTVVGAGAVTIQLRNAGEDGHDLHVTALDGTPVAAWDELAAEAPAVTKVVTLAPGTYRLYCSLPGHAALGMDTRLNVS